MPLWKNPIPLKRSSAGSVVHLFLVLVRVVEVMEKQRKGLTFAHVYRWLSPNCQQNNPLSILEFGWSFAGNRKTFKEERSLEEQCREGIGFHCQPAFV
jgi:hypothetical protein